MKRSPAFPEEAVAVERQATSRTPPPSPQDLTYHAATDISQPKVPTLKAIGQAGVVDAQTVQNGGLQVVDMNRIFQDVEPEVICLSDHLAGLDAATGKP